MRKIIAILICLTSLELSGCVNTPPVIPVTTEPEPQRTDLPINWLEVSGSNWSYGVPFGFDKARALPNDMLAQHSSQSQKISIGFAAHPTQLELPIYVANFVFSKETNNQKVLATRESTNGPNGRVFAVHYVDNAHTCLPGKTMCNTAVQGSLDFFVKKNQTIYQMSCFGEALSLKAHADTCFQVINTLRLK